MLVPWKKSYDKPRQHIKKQSHHFIHKDLSSQSYGFSNSHVQMWELDHKEGWAPKNWCFQIVVKTERRSNQSILKEINTEYSLEGLMLKLHYFGHLMQSWLIGKYSYAGNNWRQNEKGTGEDESWGCKESDTTEQLNNKIIFILYQRSVEQCYVGLLIGSLFFL